jgi:hypothetical protein
MYLLKIQVKGAGHTTVGITVDTGQPATAGTKQKEKVKAG